MSELSGSWMDEMGACRVCDGEIPHGHTNDCDIYKMEQEQNKLQQQLAATQQKLVESEARVERLKDYIEKQVFTNCHYQANVERDRDMAMMQGWLNLAANGQKRIDESSNDALHAWFRERTELIYQRLEALSLDVDSEWLKEALATLKTARGDSPNGG